MKYFLIALLFFSAGLSLAQNHKVELLRINDSAYVHLSYKKLNGYDIPSNGLIILTSAGLVLVDTPWDDEMTEELIAECKIRFGKDFMLALITHFHDDRIGGIRALQKHSVRTLSYQLTCLKAPAAGYPAPEEIVSADTSLKVGNTPIRYYYPGKGHTEDNTVVYFPGQRLLFGGCILKSAESNSIGNTADADIKAWPGSVRNIMRELPDALQVIPGHGNPGGTDLYQHTISIIKNSGKAAERN